MTAAQEILTMIETVSPDDVAKLDEIDARVTCMVRGYKFLAWPHVVNWSDGTTKEYQHLVTVEDEGAIKTDLIPYTRSRDALKAIRPEGWTMDVGQTGLRKEDGSHHMMWMCGMEKRGCDSIQAWPFPTEELAELHAIIQAIEHERKKS